MTFNTSIKKRLSSNVALLARALLALIGLIAGISYYLIQDYYHDSLQQLATITDPAARLDFTRDTYFAIGQLRYFD